MSSNTANMDAADQDPLLLLRQAIDLGGPQDTQKPSTVIPTASPDDPSNPEADLTIATHLIITHPRRVAISMDQITRFNSKETPESEAKPVNVRSIYFAYLQRDVTIPVYNESASKLNEELPGAATVSKVQYFERLQLVSWLQRADDECEYITPLAGEKDNSTVAAASSAALKGSAAPINAQARSGRGTLDPRLHGERRMGDRNTVLRGIKPTVCPLSSLPPLPPATSH